MLRLKFYLFGIFLFGCVNLFSQNQLDSIQQLQDVTIVANSYREVIPSQKLSGSELEALVGFSVADAIRYFSGVQIKDYGGVGGLKTVDIRSMGTNHTGVFYDGIQIVNAQNGQVDLGKFSMENTEEIALYNGQKSDMLQSARDYASAGSIYIRSRRPRFYGDKKTNLKATFKTGSFDLGNLAILWEQKLTDKINFSFNTEFLHSSGKYKFRYRRVLPEGTVAWDTTAVRQNGDIRAFRIETGLNGFTQRQGKWNVKAYYYDSERGVPGAIVNNVWKFSQRQWDRNFFTQGSFQEQITDRYEILINAKYGYDYLRYLNPDTTLMLIDNVYKQQEMYLSSVNKYQIASNWDVSLAVDYQWTGLDADLQDFVSPKRHTALFALATAFNWHRLKGQASLLGTLVFDEVKQIQNDLSERESLPSIETETPDEKQELTPSVFLSYKPFDRYNLNLRGFYKRIFRMPTFNDLYYTEIGNVHLKPEYTNQYNVGFQYIYRGKGILKNIGLQADAYYIEVENKIVCNFKGSNLFRGQTYNLGLVKIKGMDISAKAAWDFPFGIQTNTHLTYTYQKAQDFSYSNDITYGGQIPYIPRHSGSVLVNSSYKTWSLNYSFIYVGERYDNSANIPVNHLQPWYTHDLTLGKDILLKKGKLRVFAEVNNLANQHYDVVINYPMPGRNYKLTLKFEI